MTISFTCAACNRPCNVADKLAGRRIKCPNCGVVVQVPVDEEDASDAKASALGSRASQPDEEGDDKPTPKKRRQQDRPGNRPRRKAGNKGLIIGLAVGGALLVVVAGSIVLTILFLRGGVSAILDNPNATEDNFDKIKAGISKEDVEKILGAGAKVSYAEVFKVLHDPLPKEGVGSDGLTLKWKNQTDIILLEMYPPPGKTGADGWFVAAGWFVREQGWGKKPKYKLLGFGKLQ